MRREEGRSIKEIRSIQELAGFDRPEWLDLPS